MRKFSSKLGVAAAAIALMVAIGGLPTQSHATLISWQASLDPGQEVPPVNAPGASGMALGTINTTTGMLTWNISWSGLTGDALAMHFHGPGAIGVNAGVQVDIGAISGLASPSIGQVSIADPQIADLLNGLWYINIHTLANLPGEIRGQVERVPEPGTLGLLGAGLAGLGFVRRRRNRE